MVLAETHFAESHEIERCVLSSLFLDPWRWLPIAIDRIGPDDFADQRHGKLYSAMLDMYRSAVPFDMSFVLLRSIRKEIPFHAHEVHELLSHCATASHFEHYASQLVDLSCERQRELAVSRITDLDKLQAEIGRINRRRTPTGKQNRQGTLTEAAIRWIESQEDDTYTHRVPTFLPHFDEHIGGAIGMGEYVVVGALPGNGKTLFLLQSLKQAQHHGHKTAIISQEMSFQSLGERVIAMSYGKWDGNSKQAIEAVEKTYGSILFRQCRPSADAICAEIEALHRDGVTVFAIDYLQLLRGERKENRTNEMSGITEQVATLTARLGITTYMASQLNRSVMQQTPPIPRKHHLRDSGQIEASANWIFMLRHPIKDSKRDDIIKEYDDNLPADPDDVFEVYVEKVRNREKPNDVFVCKLATDPLGFHKAGAWLSASDIAFQQQARDDFADFNGR